MSPEALSLVPAAIALAKALFDVVHGWTAHGRMTKAAQYLELATDRMVDPKYRDAIETVPASTLQDWNEERVMLDKERDKLMTNPQLDRKMAKDFLLFAKNHWKVIKRASDQGAYELHISSNKHSFLVCSRKGSELLVGAANVEGSSAARDLGPSSMIVSDHAIDVPIELAESFNDIVSQLREVSIGQHSEAIPVNDDFCRALDELTTLGDDASCLVQQEEQRISEETYRLTPTPQLFHRYSVIPGAPGDEVWYRCERQS